MLLLHPLGKSHRLLARPALTNVFAGGILCHFCVCYCWYRDLRRCSATTVFPIPSIPHAWFSREAFRGPVARVSVRCGDCILRQTHPSICWRDRVRTTAVLDARSWPIWSTVLWGAPTAATRTSATPRTPSAPAAAAGSRFLWSLCTSCSRDDESVTRSMLATAALAITPLLVELRPYCRAVISYCHQGAIATVGWGGSGVVYGLNRFSLVRDNRMQAFRLVYKRAQSCGRRKLDR